MSISRTLALALFMALSFSAQSKETAKSASSLSDEFKSIQSAQLELYNRIQKAIDDHQSQYDSVNLGEEVGNFEADLDQIPHMARACETVGGRLPTIKELAIYHIQFGTRVFETKVVEENGSLFTRELARPGQKGWRYSPVNDLKSFEVIAYYPTEYSQDLSSFVISNLVDPEHEDNARLYSNPEYKFEGSIVNGEFITHAELCSSSVGQRNSSTPSLLVFDRSRTFVTHSASCSLRCVAN